MSTLPPHSPTILALTRYGDLGASSRARFFDYFPYLERSGCTVQPAPFFNNRYIHRLYAHNTRSLSEPMYAAVKRMHTLAVNTPSLYWIEKELFPYLPPYFEDRFLKRSPVIIDFDDAIALNYERFPKCIRKKFDYTLRNASAVTVGSSALAEWAVQARSRRVVKLPSAVDTHRLTPSPKTSSGALVVLGWIGTPSTAHFLDLIAPALRILSARHELALHVIGANKAIPGVVVNCFPWSLAAERDLLSRVDIGIMPLADTPWCRSKCAYKLVQYAAMGLPAVASAVGENDSVIAHGTTGYLARNNDEWIETLELLCSNPDLRSSMGIAARRIAEREFSLDAIAPKLIRLIQEVVASQT